MTGTTFTGVLPALITPFSDDGGTIDRSRMRTLVDRTVAAGVHGLVAAGSTGECASLTAEERKDVIDTVIDAAAGRVPTIAGTGTLSTAETIALSVHAERSGAAGVMIIPPFYGALTWRELVAHFAAVADRISIPIVYYHMPSVSGTAPSLEQFAELRRVAGVSSMKDSSGDAVAATALIHNEHTVPTLMNGADTLTFAALAAGVRGVVWGAGSFMPAECVRLYQLLIEDLDLAAGRALWARLWPICDFLESTSYPAAVKAACAMVGLETGPVRAPLLELSAAERRRLGDLLASARVATGNLVA